MTSITYKRPFLYPKQSAAFFHDKRYGLIEASTKAGKTVGGMAWLMEEAVKGRNGQNFWWVAPVYPQAEIAYSRMKRGMPQGFFVYKNDSDKRLTLPNGANLWFKSGEKPDNLYGDDVFAILGDEASRMRRESYHAMRSTTTKTRGPMRFVGNVKGRHNWFYELCRRAEAGDPDMKYQRIIAADAVAAGILDAEEIEDARRNLPEQVFRELYLAEPSDDGGNPFGYGAIQRCIRDGLSKKPPKWWGIDLAKSTDWCVLIALDEDGNVCQFYRFQKPWLETIEFIREHVRESAFVDSTGVGDPVLEALQKDRGNFEGYHFSSTSKQQLMEGLALVIQQGKIGYPPGVIPMELEQFEYEFTRTGVKYSAPEGFHDDCVCSLALAQRRRSVPLPGENILDYYARKAAAAAGKKN